MASLVPVLVAAFVAGCASAPADPEAAARRQQAVQEILSQPLDAEEYGTPRRCVSNLMHRDFEALGERYLVFDGPGNKLWLNELRGRCPGLDHANSLVFRSRSFQLCEFDQFRVSDLFLWERYRRPPWMWLNGIPCTLGKFQPVTEEQVTALREALKR
jgi:hypothetical protein